MTDRLPDKDVNMERETSSGLVLLPLELWSKNYLIYGPRVLSEATLTHLARVAEIFAAIQNSPAPVSDFNNPITSTSPSN